MASGAHSAVLGVLVHDVNLIMPYLRVGQVPAHVEYRCNRYVGIPESLYPVLGGVARQHRLEELQEPAA
jgi:hypothetical protein